MVLEENILKVLEFPFFPPTSIRTSRKYPKAVLVLKSFSLLPSSLAFPNVRGCLTQEKIVAGCAKHFIVIADYRYTSDSFSWEINVNCQLLYFKC